MSPPAIVVVGASLAGLNAVEAARDAGFDGRIVVIGAESHAPYDRPPLSKEFLAGSAARDELPLRDDEQLDGLGAEWELGRRASALDLSARTVTLDDGRAIAYDGCVLATGATPRRLPDQPDLDGIFTLRTVDDAVGLAAELDRSPRVTVVGAGFIGSEVAATARGRGCDVTVVEVAPVPLAHVLGEEMGRAVSSLHADHGVALRLGVGVAGFDGAGRVERVRLSDGSSIDADVIVVGVGVAPETDWLDGSGLRLDNGVVCDEFCFAADGVVAAGDIARWPNRAFGDELMRVEHWDNAIQQGRHAAENLVARMSGGEPAPYTPVPWFWSNQYDAKIQYAGRAAPSDEVTVISGSVEDRKFAAVYGRNGRVTAVLAIDKPRPVSLLRGRIGAGITVDEAIKEFAS